MGDYSRDPTTRLDDAVGKQYVGLRIQQGVPLLDADLNMRDDLRRHGQEAVGSWFVGDGVPVGSNGFRIVPIAGGGENTIVIDAKATTGHSKLRVDVGASSAAAALGFTARNSLAQRAGSSPARLVGDKAQPFALANNNTLVVSVDEGAPVTVTFKTANFVSISAATATEVCAVINAALADVVASSGAGNDFIIRGASRGTGGCILVAGQMAANESDLKYSQQPLYTNAGLAGQWGVDALPPLATPASDTPCIAYIDVWTREVTAAEDDVLVDVRIGVETVAALKREWAVRVVAEKDYPSVAAARPAHHAYYPLALVKRPAGTGRVTAGMITDLRTTDLSLRREVAYRSVDDVMLVDTVVFAGLMKATRDTVRGVIAFLTTKFLKPDAVCVAAEYFGLDALGAMAAVAEQGVSLVNAETLGTRGAVMMFGQLLAAEQRFIEAWRQYMLPLDKPGAGTIYGAAFTDMIDRIDTYVKGPAPNGYVTLTEALDAQDLNEAVRSQERINVELSRQLTRPVGELHLTCLGSTTAKILRNMPFDLRYRVKGSVTPADALAVQAFIDPAWTVKTRNANGSVPLDLKLGPGAGEVEFLVTVTPPDVDAAATSISLLVFAQNNSGGVRHISTAKSLAINAAPPGSEGTFAIEITTTNMPQVGGVFQSKKNVVGNMSFKLANNSNNPMVIDVEFLPNPWPTGWTIIAPAGADLTNVPVPAYGSVPRGFSFLGTNVGQTLDFRLRVSLTGTNNVICDTLVSLVAVA